LRPQALRPQLKRDPLGCHPLPNPTRFPVLLQLGGPMGKHTKDLESLNSF